LAERSDDRIAVGDEPARHGWPRTVRRYLTEAIGWLTTPLHPDDYVRLINPLWSTRGLRARVEDVRPETGDTATVVLRPGRGWTGHRAGQLDGETRGEWYLRQLLGSSNIDGGPLFHVMTGNLSHQIEHHLFPDLPSNRYAEIAPKIQDLCRRYGLRYNTGPLIRQTASVWNRILRLAVPGPKQELHGQALRSAARDST
jgi:Fatty acid desaturase